MSIVNATNDDASVAILELFPRQGEWRDGDYFSLPGNRIVELVNGHVEVLPVPSLLHQFIARLVFLQMHGFVEQSHLGIVMSAPTRVRISERHFREPDVLFVSQVNSRRRQEEFWETADLVVEIMSHDDPDRDLVDKRRDYAVAGIAEYWMIDPRNDSIQVLHLHDGEYRQVIRPGATQHAVSRVLPGFTMDVEELFAKARVVGRTGAKRSSGERVTRMTTKPIPIFLFVLHTSCLVVHAQQCSPCLRRGIHCSLPAPEADAARIELGSKTAKDGFRKEDAVRDKFNNWQTDADARAWLAAMNYKLADIDGLTASKPHGEKADVEVTVRTKSGERVARISIKLVSSPNGFNQIDKRWLATYAKLWKIPAEVVEALKLYVGETPPRESSRDRKRMYLDELDANAQKAILDFFTANKDQIVSDLLAGDGVHAAGWMMVTSKTTDQPKWIIRSSADTIKYFGEGDVKITKSGNLKIGRITMQRKGGDNGRETANMLQFKINPVQLFEAK